MLCAAAAFAILAPLQVERGRDPWVFRAVFEDRPRSVVIAAGHKIWFSFNPATCAFHKIWLGEIDLLGKVYDFSQDNSHAKGAILAKSYDEVFVLPNGETPPGWVFDRVDWKEGWHFSGDGASITSPKLDLSGFDTLYVAFDERSRKGRLRIEVLNEGKVTEFFTSSTDVSSDTNWMWNFKYLLDRGASAQIRFKQDKASDAKGMRSARLFGDRPGWALEKSGSIVRAEPKFLGYETEGTKSCRLFFELKNDSGRVKFQVRPEVMMLRNGPQWSLSYSVLESEGGVVPVMLGWNDHLKKSEISGRIVQFRGLDGMRLEQKTFILTGGSN